VYIGDKGPGRTDDGTYGVQATNVSEARGVSASTNEFLPIRQYLDASLKIVVRSNVHTL
jgi:hypothetical protein